MSCGCSCFVTLPHGAEGWYAVCDCGISLSYSLTFSDGRFIGVQSLMECYDFRAIARSFDITCII